MKGTEKQIAWAEDIKAAVVAVMDKTAAECVKIAVAANKPVDGHPMIAYIETRKTALLSCESASAIINCFKNCRFSGKDDGRSVAEDFARLRAVYNVAAATTDEEKNLLLR